MTWSIKRTRGATATATSERGDTVAGLATLIGLDPSEFGEWLQAPGGLALDGEGSEPAPSLGGLKLHDRLDRGQEAQVPNTILAHWGGSVGAFGRWWIRWRTEIRTLRDRGFHVEEQRRLPALELEQVIARGQRQKRLFGIYVWGHGNPGVYFTHYYKAGQSPTWESRFDFWQPHYRLAFGYLGACDSQSAKPHFSPAAAFWGYTGILNPVWPPWRCDRTAPRIGTLLPPGAHGTR